MPAEFWGTLSTLLRVLEIVIVKFLAVSIVCCNSCKLQYVFATVADSGKYSSISMIEDRPPNLPSNRRIKVGLPECE
jgi:hypothetical protein